MVMVALKCITHLLSVVVALVGEDGLQGGPERSSTFTAVRATQVAVFMWTNLPRLAFPRTKQYGTSNLRQRVGRKTIISMGSTSWAMTTSWAFLDSTNSVTWLRPNLMWLGLSPFQRTCQRPSSQDVPSSRRGSRACIYRGFEELGLLITCNGRLELGNAWRDLQSLHKNSLLTLNTDVLGPSDEAGEIALGLDVSTDSEVMGVLLEEGFLGLGFAAVLFDEHGPFGGCLLYHLRYSINPTDSEV